MGNWYLYIGKAIRPIPTGDGDVVACHPSSYIQIHSSTPEVARLIREKKLRRVGRPKKGATVVRSKKIDNSPLTDHMPKSAFSSQLTELGSGTPATIESNMKKKEKADRQAARKKEASKEAEQPEKPKRRSRRRKTAAPSEDNN